MAKLSADKKSVTVQKGDTLSQIALDYKSYSGGKTYQQLATLNNISNPNRIYVGQVIKLTSTASTGSSASSSTTTNTVTVKQFGLQSDTADTLFVIWDWAKHSQTEEYKVRWKYYTENKVWFLGKEESTKEKESIYTIPSNAIKVGVNIRPISKTKKVSTGNGKTKDTVYWTADWFKEYLKYNVSDVPPGKPPKPTVEIDAKTSTLTATVTDLGELNATHIEFYTVVNEKTKYNSALRPIDKTNTSTYTLGVKDGNTYRVRCRAVRGDTESDWSEYSESHSSKPSAPSKITECKAHSDTEVRLKWTEVKNVESYDVEYTTKVAYFDSSSNTTVKSNIETNSCIISGLEPGETYYFRVRSVNKTIVSSWSDYRMTSVGKEPEAPTTWSYSTTAGVGEDLVLYWQHNSVDNSSQTYADLELYLNGSEKPTITVENIKNTTDEDEKDKTSSVTISYKNSYLIVTDRFGKEWYRKSVPDFGDGAKLEWRVRTCGVTLEVGPWSVTRTINIYAKPTLSLTLEDQNGVKIDKLESFPLYISCFPGPNTQKVIGYHISVIANETHETIDEFGNERLIAAGQTVYSNYIDNPNRLIVRNDDGSLEYVETDGTPTEFLIELSAGNIDLKSGVSYTIRATVSMNSGLTATQSQEFTVSWNEIPHLHLYSPYAGSIGNRIWYQTEWAAVKPYYFTHTPGVEYTLSFKARTDDDGVDLVKNENGEWEYVPKAVLVSCVGGNLEQNSNRYELTCIWQEYSFTYTAVSDGSLTLWLERANSSVDIADLKLIPTGETESVLIDNVSEYNKCWNVDGNPILTAVNAGYLPNAEIGIDYDNLSAFIRPYVEDENGNIIEGVKLSVFRREFDGSFTEICSNVENAKDSFYTDPHPSLDYARYRIVATTDTTGAVGYYDVPGVPVDEVAMIIQWDEQWSDFDISEEDMMETPHWEGSLLRLPYNIDIADKNDPDVSLAKYIGRDHPVTYYGTQKGMSSTWTTVIPKEDKETIYALRRLANWMGDVYVREPSGTGYWAHIKVSFPLKHLDVTTTVTFDVTRVEGGI